MHIVPAPKTAFIIPLKVDTVKKSESGLIIASSLSAREGDTVDERGKGTIAFAGEHCWAAAGSTVIYKDYEAHEVEVEGTNYIVVKDDAIVARIAATVNL